MKKLCLASAFLATAALMACGSDNLRPQGSAAASALKDTNIIYKIQPLNVSTSCLGSSERIVRDHRYNPPLVYSLYVLSMKDCSPPASSLVIQMLGGQTWPGGYSYVTIKKNGLCLTNPVTYSPNGADKGETYWKPCVVQNSSLTDRFRQQWLLVFNSHNAMQIQTHTAVSLGFPNAQVQCLDRQSPTEVKRVACTLNNWQVVRAN